MGIRYATGLRTSLKGPELRTQLQDNQQCMNLVQDAIIYPEQFTSVQMTLIPEISEPEAQDPLEVPLKPGQRYGWWEDHEHGDMHELATIHGAVNDSRTKILLDTGASVSIMSLDLARRLKLKLRTHRQIKGSGLGGVTTYITTHARVKLTLGWSVVYVGNIGQGVDVLLGMNFMHSAGVRFCIRDGLFRLPDEETVVIYDANPKSRGMDLPVCPEDQHLVQYFQPRYSGHTPHSTCIQVRTLLYESGMASRTLYRRKLGDQSPVFCQILGDYCQDQNVWIDTRTAVARIVEYGQFPGQPGFVRPGKARYEEWQQLIHGCTVSRQILRERESPCIQTQRYQWPTKLLMRPKSQAAEVSCKKSRNHWI
ncbi:hypothetical protein PHMEG_00014541 [Phytophthora megakarya]|uniref:Peptidase A2 domain-containing protein n=1 Tax=Phytophthora megakarya TaxID=4795 RepID=A0A225W3I5_9STRA|nr:hypothetical protein PHMEG_00014541 [Phytophthora megakarya]